MTPRRTTRMMGTLGLVLASFAVGYLARGLDPEFGEWLEERAAAAGTPSPGTRLTFDATAYCKGTTTASGVTAQTGVAAADPTLLPVGSVVNVATGDPQYNGVYTIMDTGPKVQGRVLDLYMWSCHKALDFGRRGVDVTVLRLGWNPQASAPSLIDRLFRGREARRRVPPPEPPPPAGIPVEGAADAPDADAADTQMPEPPQSGTAPDAATAAPVLGAGASNPPAPAPTPP